MKKIWLAGLNVLVAVTALLWLSAAAAHAGTFLGDFCWGTPDGAIMKLGVSRVGTGHLQLNGAILDSGGKLDSVVTGNGELSGGKAHLTLVMSSSGGDMVSGVFHVILNAGSLNGTGEALMHYWDTISNDLEVRYESMPLNRKACP